MNFLEEATRVFSPLHILGNINCFKIKNCKEIQSSVSPRGQTLQAFSVLPTSPIIFLQLRTGKLRRKQKRPKKIPVVLTSFKALACTTLQKPSEGSFSIWWLRCSLRRHIFCLMTKMQKCILPRSNFSSAITGSFQGMSGQQVRRPRSMLDSKQILHCFQNLDYVS